MSKTKEKIIATSIEVFNQRGYASVNLRELSEILGISRGNLTYHFKDKEDLLTTIVNEMWESITGEMAKTLQVPSFESMHNQTQLYYKYQKRYAFIFLDIHVQTHPAVHQRFREMIEQTIESYSKMIAFGIQIGTVKEEQVPGSYQSLVHAVWMTSFYRLAQRKTRNISEADDLEMLIWGLILPHLTENGLKGFKDFFGEDYFNQLGEPFDVEKHAFVAF